MDALRSSSRLLLAILALAVLGARAGATHYYVDPVNGEDANTGLAPGTAWRTITHALGAIPSGVHTLHLAPGVYDTAGGEVFPLLIRHGLTIVGDGGSAVTRIEGGGFRGGTHPPAPVVVTRLQGVTLSGGQYGFRLFYPNGTYGSDVSFEDVQVLDVDGIGISVSAYGEEEVEAARATLSSVVVRNCTGTGVAVPAEWDAAGWLEATDCVIADNGEKGVRLFGWLGRSVVATRCRITGNGLEGIDASDPSFGPGSVVLRDCLVAGNGEEGVAVRGTSSALLDLGRCTVADNGGPGARVSGNGLGVFLTSSILAGNQDELVVGPGSLTVTYSCIDDPDVPFDPTNFAGDPGFVDAAAGDYRLRFPSRCVDNGDPTLLPSSGDVHDGDLDTGKAPDMGAFELAPLDLVGEPQVGGELLLDLWGPSGGSTLLYFAPARLTAPTPTPFGELELERAQLVLLGTLPTAPGPPARTVLPLPDDPSQAGSPWSLQGLCLGSAAQPLRALTNAVGFELLP